MFQKIKNAIFGNKVTSAFGGLSGGAILIEGLQDGDKTKITYGIVLIVLGLLSADGIKQ